MCNPVDLVWCTEGCASFALMDYELTVARRSARKRVAGFNHCTVVLLAGLGSALTGNL
jgi:hypothetical protein